MKKNILFFILGAIVFSSITAYATIKYQANEIGYKDGTVEEALNDLYSKTNSVNNKICILLSEQNGTKGNVGSKYVCNLGDGVARNFYILKTDGSNVKLIMDRNITQGTSNKTLTWNAAKQYIEDNIRNIWNKVLDVSLPDVQDIANAVGNNEWIADTKTSADYFCIGTGYTKFCRDNEGSSKNDEQTLRYNWLINYTRNCSNYGCDPTTSLSSDEARGYWTKNLVNDSSSSKAWLMDGKSNVGSNPIDTSDSWGVRPVITVLKSNLYE